MQSRIVEIAKRSKDWIQNKESNIINVIETNQGKTVDLNRSQMIAHMDADGKALIHNRTGSKNLSKAYAKRTHKTRPDLFLRGDFQNEMFLFMPNIKEYFITSKNYLTLFLSKNYGKIFGIDTQNQPKAQNVNDKLVINDYFQKVFK